MYEVIFAIIFLIAGIILITYCSEIAVKHSALLATVLGISPLIIGISLVSIGTDLPEIFNSIISCSLGHGDIDVGDSVGSDLTQLTLIFGLITIIAGSFKVDRKEIIVLGACEILSLILIYTIVEKGYFTRLNAIIMVGSLVVYLIIIINVSKDSILERVDFLEKTEITRSKSFHIILASLGFIGVAIGSYAIVQSIITLSSLSHIQEYIISFFIASLGTSLPELAIDINAIRNKHYKIAIGDIIGSCIVDSTLSIGIGQVLFPQAVSAELAVPTILYTLFASFLVFTIVAVRKKMDKKTGVIFILLYLFSYFLLYFMI
jgi:cation:H+ antiporter